MTHRSIARARRAAVAAVAAGLLTLTAACATGPTTRKEVCGKYDSLGERIGIGVVVGDPVFWAAGSLADVAGRYPGPEDLSADAERLDDISDSDETSLAQLSDATESIAALCGHPLGLGRTTP
ncbi:molybdenum ABC transporter substrate-binding protein [Streptomyces sp. NPDC046831]|uniref:molybdenum ABC transporter substrate-binding protein n=1 Tax=Streptomyces sp. NPDC046831 TaxID=3154805 RepID=UPI0033DCD364